MTHYEEDREMRAVLIAVVCGLIGGTALGAGCMMMLQAGVQGLRSQFAQKIEKIETATPATAHSAPVEAIPEPPIPVEPLTTDAAPVEPVQTRQTRQSWPYPEPMSCEWPSPPANDPTRIPPPMPAMLGNTPAPRPRPRKVRRSEREWRIEAVVWACLLTLGCVLVSAPHPALAPAGLLLVVFSGVGLFRLDAPPPTRRKREDLTAAEAEALDSALPPVPHDRRAGPAASGLAGRRGRTVFVQRMPRPFRTR